MAPPDHAPARARALISHADSHAEIIVSAGSTRPGGLTDGLANPVACDLLGASLPDLPGKPAAQNAPGRFKVTVRGHTDNTDEPEKNQQLSGDRAMAVERWLKTKSRSTPLRRQSQCRRVKAVLGS